MIRSSFPVCSFKSDLFLKIFLKIFFICLKLRILSKTFFPLFCPQYRAKTSEINQVTSWLNIKGSNLVSSCTEYCIEREKKTSKLGSKSTSAKIYYLINDFCRLKGLKCWNWKNIWKTPCSDQTSLDSKVFFNINTIGDDEQAKVMPIDIVILYWKVS